MTPAQQRIYDKLVDAAPAIVTAEQLAGTGSRKSLQVQICLIRKSLPPELTIVNHWGEGYSLHRATQPQEPPHEPTPF